MHSSLSKADTPVQEHTPTQLHKNTQWSGARLADMSDDDVARVLL